MTTKKSDLIESAQKALDALNDLREENRMSALDQESIEIARTSLLEIVGDDADSEA